MCRSIAAWAKKVGKAKLDAEADDIQPIIDSIQASCRFVSTFDLRLSTPAPG